MIANLLPRNPARPIKPDPNNQAAAGIGVVGGSVSGPVRGTLTILPLAMLWLFKLLFVIPEVARKERFMPSVLDDPEGMLK